jgi:hypothetical protein
MAAIVLIGSLFFPLLAGCAGSATPIPITFESLCGLTHEQFEQMDEEALLRWIQDAIGTPPPWKNTVGTRVTFSWPKGNRAYGHAYLYFGRLVRIELESIGGGPTLGQVVDALGKPEWVRSLVTRREDTLYWVNLEYPGLGFSVATSSLEKGNVRRVTLSKHMRVTDVFCYAPGSMEQVLQRAFFYSKQAITTSMERSVPWPGFGETVRLP